MYLCFSSDRFFHFCLLSFLALSVEFVFLFLFSLLHSSLLHTGIVFTTDIMVVILNAHWPSISSFTGVWVICLSSHSIPSLLFVVMRLFNDDGEFVRRMKLIRKPSELSFNISNHFSLHCFFCVLVINFLFPFLPFVSYSGRFPLLKCQPALTCVLVFKSPIFSCSSVKKVTVFVLLGKCICSFL